MFTSRTEHIDALLALICEDLQLPPSVHDLAEQRYHAIGAWLGREGSMLAAWRPTIYPQGSFRIGTNLHPLAGDEFDLDLVCELDLGLKPASPLVVLNMVEQRLRQHSSYAGMVERKKRCIRLTYAREFHLDVLPARPTWPPDGTQVQIPDRELGAWLKSNPKGYAAWFESRSKLYFEALHKRAVEPLPDHEHAHEKTTLQRAVQLLKRWRDVCYEQAPQLAPRSIVLTTMAGQWFAGSLSTFNAFGTIVAAIAQATAQNGAPFVVVNPTQPAEVLSEQWRDEPPTYRVFALRIADLHRQWATLQASGTTEQVAATLGELFGEHVTQRAFKRLTNERVEPRRQNGTLGVSRSLGAMSLAPIAGIAPVRPHTFYGEE
jgi:hypothetical protein